MKRYQISQDASAGDFLPLAMCIHELLNHLPITAKSKNKPGVRIEDGRVIDTHYSGPILEEVIKKNETLKTTPAAGPYKGVPVVVAPLRNDEGEVLGAIGVVDITGIFDLATLMEHQSAILKQVCGKDPCPLPTELISGRK